MALSPDERTLLVPGAGRGNIVRIQYHHGSEGRLFPQVMRVVSLSAMGFRPENGEVIFADQPGDFTYRES